MSLDYEGSSPERRVVHYTYEDIARMIDHSLLNPTLRSTELEDGCVLAIKYGVASV